MNLILPIILCGGSGTRMWPLSRSDYPKQFLALLSDKSMFQETILRLKNNNILSLLDPVIICNKEYHNIVSHQLNEINAKHNGIILEPEGKNTAPAATIGAMHAIKKFGEEVSLFILPSDHFVEDSEGLMNSILLANKILKSYDAMITFGIKPRSAHTGYGYIKVGGELTNYNAYIISEFKEKPNKKTAESYVISESYLWNSGMFFCYASNFISLIKEFSPAIFKSCYQAFLSINENNNILSMSDNDFSKSPSDSIDYAVMENCILNNRDAFVFPLDIGWSDIGAWSSLWSLSKKDDKGNTSIGKIYPEDTSNSLLYSDDGILATIGVNDMIIINTKDATLVASKDRSEDVSLIPKKLIDENVNLSWASNKKYTNWGNYRTIIENDVFMVSHLAVKPNSTMLSQPNYIHSGQMTVVKGSAKVIYNDEIIILNEKETIFISDREDYSIENIKGKFLELVVVQTVKI